MKTKDLQKYKKVYKLSEKLVEVLRSGSVVMVSDGYDDHYKISCDEDLSEINDILSQLEEIFKFDFERTD